MLWQIFLSNFVYLVIGSSHYIFTNFVAVYFVAVLTYFEKQELQLNALGFNLYLDGIVSELVLQPFPSEISCFTFNHYNAVFRSTDNHIDF